MLNRPVFALRKRLKSLTLSRPDAKLYGYCAARKVPAHRRKKTKPAVILIIIFYLVFINLVPLLLYYINDYRYEAGKKPLPEVLYFLSMLLGGGPGMLLCLFLHREMRERPRAFSAMVCIALWAVLIAAVAAAAPNKLTPAETEIAENTTDPGRTQSSEDAAPSTTTAEPTTTTAEPTTTTAEPTTTTEEPTTTTEEPTTTTEEPTTTTEPEPEPRWISIVAIGDMLMHPGVSGSARQPDGSYDYTVLFEPIAEDVRNASIAILNNEVPFGGDEFGLQNYPNFNVYSALGDGEVAAGFDVILNATNHVRDMGTSGLQRTIDFWKKYPNIASIGVHDTPEDQQRVRILTVNDIRVAVLNYCYGINAGFPADTPYMIDMMREQDKPKIIQDLQYAEWAADFTIVCPHWGEEYHLCQTAEQEEWAKFFTEYGADLIIGTHPHVLEPIKTITASNGNTSLCYYSLGNYISMQDETFGVLGGMAKVVILSDKDGTRIVSHDIQYLVTHYLVDVSWARVYKLEDYTPALASQHAILVGNLPGNGFNQYYPFSLDTLHRIINEVNSY